MKKYSLMTATAITTLMSYVSSFAGEKSNLVKGATDGLLEKPNTGDTNSLLIYGGLIAVVLLLLIVINIKGSKDRESVENNEDENESNDN